MKRRVLALLLLFLHVAQIAHADLLVVWLPYPAAGASTFLLHQWQSQRDAVTQLLDQYVGPDNWQGVDPRGTRTLWCNTGTQVWNPGASTPNTRQFDAVMYVGFSLTNGATIPFAGSPVRVDSLLRIAVWNGASGYGTSVPQIFVGGPTGDPNHWAQTSTCSTGTDAYGAGYATARGQYSTYMVGKPFVWKEFSTGASGMYAPPATATRAHGIWRPIVSYGATGITSAALRNCTSLPCDNVTRSNNPDSVLLWVRYRDANDPAPRIFVQPGGLTSALFDMGLVKMALAIVDSVTGGDIFEDPKLIPKRRALWIRHGFSRGAITNQSSADVGGLVCNAAVCDSADFKTGIDSLASLKIPFTVGVDVDSIATYPFEKTWWARAPLARFGLETYAGAITGRGTTASSTHPMDPFGNKRARAMSASATLPVVCGSGDSTSFCLLKASGTIMEANFPGKVDHAIWPAWGDYSPTGATLATAGAYADSVPWVARNAGWKAIVFNPLHADGNSGRTWSTNGGITTTAASAPLGWDPDTRRVKTLDGQSFKFLAARMEAASADTFSMSGHALGSEFQHGALRSNWYPDRGSTSGIGLDALYGHDFMTRTPILAFNACNLGSIGLSSSSGMTPYWQAKWITNQWRAVDALLPGGKKLDVWDYVENLDVR